jgi:inositol oxygenase
MFPRAQLFVDLETLMLVANACEPVMVRGHASALALDQLAGKPGEHQANRKVKRSLSDTNLSIHVEKETDHSLVVIGIGDEVVSTCDGPCAICMQDTSHPVELRCGHNFCRGCLVLASFAANLSKMCPLCRAVHELNPDVLKQRTAKYRQAYSDWRQGAAKGAKGDVAQITAPADQKQQEEFRNYTDSYRQAIVQEFYRTHHIYQCYDLAKRKQELYGALKQREMTVWEVIELLDTLVDDSDPDTDVPNSFHDFQTAERIRAVWPDHDWFHLVGLLHDLGKILCIFGEPQWAVVGDTFPLGCKFSDKIAFPQYLEENPDRHHPIYSTEHGVYEPGCGLSSVTMTYGHDEYMYNVLVGNGCPIPEEGLYMIRFHSFYPWHKEQEYKWMEDEKDREMLPWVLEFNKFDLYSKSDDLPDPKALRPYYQSLIDKYCPGKLRW